MTQEHSRRGGVEPDTSERLYTADDLASYTASRLHAESPPPAPHGDPLTDPLDGADSTGCATSRVAGAGASGTGRPAPSRGSVNGSPCGAGGGLSACNRLAV